MLRLILCALIALTLSSILCSQALPTGWIGTYEGDLKIYNSSGLAQTIQMTLDVLPRNRTDSIDWKITYRQDTIKDIRPYSLVAQDTLQHHYVIDEHNGIILDAYLLNNKLTSVFEVMNSTLVVSYSLTENHHIDFHITVFNPEVNRTSSTESTSGDKSINVSSYKVVSTQEARLYKSK